MCRALPPTSPDKTPGGGGAKSSHSGTGNGLPRSPGSKGGTVAGRFSMANDNWGGVFSAEVSSFLRSANRESSSAFMAFAADAPAS